MSGPVDVLAVRAAQKMALKLGYIQYNYGPHHPLTAAAEAGDISAFRRAGSGITEMMDSVVVSIIDAPDFVAVAG